MNKQNIFFVEQVKVRDILSSSIILLFRSIFNSHWIQSWTSWISYSSFSNIIQMWWLSKSSHWNNSTRIHLQTYVLIVSSLSFTFSSGCELQCHIECSERTPIPCRLSNKDRRNHSEENIIRVRDWWINWSSEEIHFSYQN